MRLNFKKSMLAAGVLAALIAGSAFAATPLNKTRLCRTRDICIIIG